MKRESNGEVWGEVLTDKQLSVAKFLVSGPDEQKSQVTRQSVLPVMTGNTWLTLAKEMSWRALDWAWSLTGMEEFEDWGPRLVFDR